MKSKRKDIILTLTIVTIITVYLVFKYWGYIDKYFDDVAIWIYPESENKKGLLFELYLKILGGVAILYGLFVSYRRVKAMEMGVFKQGEAIQNQNKQLALSIKSQINDQFKNAVEHLGSDKETVILGGVSELHKLAEENNKEYSLIVSNIFSGYLKSNYSTEKKIINNEKLVGQTIIDYLFKTDIYKNDNLKLNNINLTSFNIDGCKFYNSDFSYSFFPFQISDVVFTQCKISSAKFNLCRLEKVVFIECDFFDTFFNGVAFKFVDIMNESSDSQKIISLGSVFSNCNFEMDLYNTSFISSDFIDCKLLGKSYMSSNFNGSSFLRTNFIVEELTNCDFIACGFVDSGINSSLMECSFNGIQNECSGYAMLFDIKTREIINKLINKNGLIIKGSYMYKCSFDVLSSEEGEDIFVNYEDLKYKYSTRVAGDSKLTKKDLKTINDLLNILDIKSFQEEIVMTNSWYGYNKKAIKRVLDFIEEVDLINRKTSNYKLNSLLQYFKFTLETFTNYSAKNMVSNDMSYELLLKLKEGDVPEADRIAKKINKKAKNGFVVLKEIIDLENLNNQN